jgi:hypothetical protein
MFCFIQWESCAYKDDYTAISVLTNLVDGCFGEDGGWGYLNQSYLALPEPL